MSNTETFGPPIENGCYLPKGFSMLDGEAALRQLYRAFEGSPETHLAYCCGRLSLARTPQRACMTCTNTPRPVRVTSLAEALTWFHRTFQPSP